MGSGLAQRRAGRTGDREPRPAPLANVGGRGPRTIAAVRLKAERVTTLRGPGEPEREVPDGLVHRLENADEPLCGAAVTPLYLVEWEWDQLNDLMKCSVCATLAQTSP